MASPSAEARAAGARASVHKNAEAFGNLLSEVFHYLALFAIGATIVWSAAVAYMGMVEKGAATIDDILLLFIYLELGAMVGIYFKTTHMPVRFLIYIGITALVRLLISHVQVHHKPDLETLWLTAAILVLAIATLVIRIGSAKFPSPGGERGDPTTSEKERQRP